MLKFVKQWQNLPRKCTPELFYMHPKVLDLLFLPHLLAKLSDILAIERSVGSMIVELWFAQFQDVTRFVFDAFLIAKTSFQHSFFNF